MNPRRVVPLARIAGIEIRIHVSWVIIVAFLTVGAATQPEAFPADW